MERQAHISCFGYSANHQRTIHETHEIARTNPLRVISWIGFHGQPITQSLGDARRVRMSRPFHPLARRELGEPKVLRGVLAEITRAARLRIPPLKFQD